MSNVKNYFVRFKHKEGKGYSEITIPSDFTESEIIEEFEKTITKNTKFVNVKITSYGTLL